MIQVPLDNRHYLIIYPNTEELIKEMVFRSRRDFYFVLTSNHNAEENAEDWIMGKPGTVQAHTVDQAKHFGDTLENASKMDAFAELARNAKTLSNLIDQYGITHEVTINKIKELVEDPLHKNDVALHDSYNELKRKGYII